MELIVTIVAMASVAGAAAGWWHGTRNINNPPDKHSYPGGMTRQEHLSLLRRKHRKRRLPLAIGSGLAAGVAAFAALIALAVPRR